MSVIYCICEGYNSFFLFLYFITFTHFYDLFFFHFYYILIFLIIFSFSISLISRRIKVKSALVPQPLIFLTPACVVSSSLLLWKMTTKFVYSCSKIPIPLNCKWQSCTRRRCMLRVVFNFQWNFHFLPINAKCEFCCL